jgi:cell wall-associated NlpC family hydrolase
MNKRKIVHTLAAVCLILTSNVSALADPLADLVKEKQSQEQRLDEQNSSYDDAQKKLFELEDKIEKLDVEIGKMMNEIDENKKAISKSEEDIAQAMKDVAEAEADIAAQQKLYDSRMRAIYKTGTRNYMQMLLDTDNLGQLITKVNAIAKISELDKKVVKELNDKRVLLQEKRARLESENKRLLDLKTENEQKLATLNEYKNSQLPLVEEARIERDKQETQVAQIKNLIANAQSKIKEIENLSRGSVPYSTDLIVSYSFKFLEPAIPYKYGGTSPETGFDCSGFMQYIHAQFGVYLPRTSGEQFNTGTPVSRENLMPGDLVFFGYGGDVSHVGMYIGNDQYIHSPQTGDVIKISALTGRRYIGARRVR